MKDGFYDCTECGERLLEGEQVKCETCKERDDMENDLLLPMDRI